MSSRVRAHLHSVVIADPHRAQRERLRALVDHEPDLAVAAVTGHRDEAAQLLWKLEPDAAVIDVGLLSACEFPLHGWGPIPGGICLVAVGLADDSYLASTLRAAGFSAYLPEGRLDEQLGGVLRAGPATGRGLRFRPPGAGSRTARAPARFTRRSASPTSAAGPG